MYRDHRDVQLEQLRAENAALRAGPMSALDWIATALAATGLAGLLALSLVTGTFAAMYRDFGAALPLATRVALSPLAPLALALLPGALLAAALRRGAPLATRRRLVFAAFIVEMLAIALLLWALYAPVFALAGSIRAE